MDTPAFTSHWLRGQQQGQKGEKERHSRLLGNYNWPREPYHLPLYPNSLLNKSSLVEPPPNTVPFHRGRVTTTAAGPNLCRCSDPGTLGPKIHPSGGERDFLTWPRGGGLGGLQLLPFKDTLIFDQWPTQDMFATCVTFGSNRCPSKTGGRLELLHMAANK